MKFILQAMTSLYPPSAPTIEALKEKVGLCLFRKKTLLVQAHCHAPMAYFIEKGITRSFWVVDGEEITTSFSTEGSIVFSMDALYYNQTSEEYVEALEDVTAYRISLTALRELFRTNIELANWGRIIHQNEYRRLHRSHKERLTLPARERYLNFTKQFPDVSRRVNLGYIASYLGITPSTLSRLRAELVEGNHPKAPSGK